jgi:CubicO group peptidase (beta-lactamase class C family)
VSRTRKHHEEKNMKHRIASPLFLAFALVATCAHAAPPPDIDAYVAQALKTFDAPGFSLSVVEGDKTVHAKGYGVRKLGEKAPADEHTIFPMGSCTKAMTAAALAILVDDGKLAWSDKVADRLPGFKMYDPYTTANMTVKDLLAHNSGMPLGAGDLLWLGGSDYTRRGVMERLRYIKPVKSFREGYAYDNVLYAVAGLLVEQVSGMTWETFMEKRVFAPLGMKDSTVPWVKAQKSRNHASLHARLSTELRGTGPNEVLADRDAELDNGSTAPAGSVYASAVDIAQWMKVQLAKGALPDGKRLWSEQQAAEMWTGVTIQPTRGGGPAPLAALKPNFSLYALGWVVEDYRGHKIVQHSGGVFGGAAFVVLIPGKNVGIAGMVNSEDGAVRRAVVYHLVDHYLGLEPIDWIANYRTVVDQMLAMGAQALKAQPAEGGAGAGPGPSLPLEKYAGTYEDAWYGTISIKHDGKGLSLQFDRTARLHAPLEHVRHDTFRTRFPERNIEDAYVTFALNPDGSIDQVKMKAVSPLADFSFNYHDLLLKPVPAKPKPPAS